MSRNEHAIVDVKQIIQQARKKAKVEMETFLDKGG